MKIVNRLTRSGTVQSPTEDLSIGIGAEPHRLCYMQTTGLDRKLIEAISVIPYIKGKGITIIVNLNSRKESYSFEL